MARVCFCELTLQVNILWIHSRVRAYLSERNPENADPINSPIMNMVCPYAMIWESAQDVEFCGKHINR